MTQFFKKYKWTILYITVIIFLYCFFVPVQKEYYLESDIKKFKSQYLIPTLISLFGIISFGFFIYLLIKTRAIKQSIFHFLYTVLIFTGSILVFHDVFLGVALFLNRQIQKGKITKVYFANFITETEFNKSNFYPCDLTTGQIIIDENLKNKLYKPELKQLDQITLPMKIGLFSIPYNSQKFNKD